MYRHFLRSTRTHLGVTLAIVGAIAVAQTGGQAVPKNASPPSPFNPQPCSAGATSSKEDINTVLLVGGFCLDVSAIQRPPETKAVKADAKITAGGVAMTFQANAGEQPVTVQVPAHTGTIADIVKQFNSDADLQKYGVVASSTRKPGGDSLRLQTLSGKPLQLEDQLDRKNQAAADDTRQPTPPEVDLYQKWDVTISVRESDTDRKGTRELHIHASDGSILPLTPQHPWTLTSDDEPLAILSIDVNAEKEVQWQRGLQSGTTPCEGDPLYADSSLSPYIGDVTFRETADAYRQFCHAQIVIVRGSRFDTAFTSSRTDNSLVLFPGAQVDAKYRLLIYHGFQKDFEEATSAAGQAPALLKYSVNRRDFMPSLLRTPNDRSLIVSGPGFWTIARESANDQCALETSSVVLPTPVVPARLQPGNGITVGTVKVFDVLTLRRMLSDTAAQLATLSGFNASSLNAAVGTLQGVSRDTSYLNLQVTTAPTASVAQSLTNGVTTPNTVTTTMPAGNTTVQLQCPDGTLPAIGTSNTVGGCAPITTSVVSGSTTTNYQPVTAPPGGFQGTLTTTPAGSVVQNSGTTMTSQNGTTTTTPSVTGTAPAALASTALNAPTNIGNSSADILAEQVQLNAQITTLRLLLQGALSDQYLTNSTKVVNTRRQTTIGFNITLDPPRQFRHAVAEVRIAVAAPDLMPPPSIVTLLPAEKTYNVAKITSNQKAFGAGVVIQPVSVGVSTGKAKDRLYLAKDTDTLALQFPTSGREIGRNVPAYLSDNVVKRVSEFQRLGVCGDPGQPNDSGASAVVFGWQFRPVLGADYVKGGQRQVFAQLALPVPNGADQPYAPRVYVETRWHEYDSSRQVVGATLTASCSFVEETGALEVIDTPNVQGIDISDLGGGLLKVVGHGDFLTSSIGIQAGASILTPTTFDGFNLQIVANAKDLIQAGDLMLVTPQGNLYPFAEPTFSSEPEVCGFRSARMTAAPFPDGNSRVQITLVLGSHYNPAYDREPNPLVLIGGTVYGLRETPFTKPTVVAASNGASFCTSDRSPTCTYRFIAPTAALRNAQTFFVADLASDSMHENGMIEFVPSFSGISIIQSDPGSVSDAETAYSVSGFDLLRIKSDCGEMTSSEPCLRVFVGNQEAPLNDIDFTLQTENVATMTIKQVAVGKAKAIRFQLVRNGEIDNRVEWSLPIPKTQETQTVGTPSFVRVADSRKVTFTGGDFAKIDTVTFEGQRLDFKYNVQSSSLDIQITTAVTKLPGHKELTGTGGGSTVSLGIDVVRQ